ncbi:MAG: hypothetical protein O3A95_03635 [Planctomycetota bacterium]|nr:hypothetical protein [Planctomycetota bacterium]MDA1113373.1 hypothetical protein [Planctomycetota bacterium]
MFKKTILFASVSAALLSPVFAQEVDAPIEAPAPVSNPALDAILEHVPAILDHAWKSTFNVSVHEGEVQSWALVAGVQFQDAKHFSVNLDMTVQDDFEGEKQMQFTVLADGTYIYVDSPSLAELSGGLASGPVKVELALLGKMLSSQMGGGMSGEGGMDKAAIKKMASGALEGFTFKEEGSGEGLRRYTLTGADVNGFIAFEKEHWFLSAMEMSIDEGKTVVNATENAFIEEFPEGTFTFTVTEGQTVMDLSPMIQMQMPQEEVADDDLEF